MHESATSTTDRWLSRLSHAAQFGLFLFTVGSLYFTVLPLYQKAVLEEAIAKKEVELKVMNAALAKSYARIRSASIRELHFRGVGDCTTLWRQPPLPEELGGPVAPKVNRYESSLEFDTRGCLKRVAALPQVVSDLNPEDLVNLGVLVEEAASRIDHEREQARTKYQSVARNMTQDKANAMRLSGARAHVLDTTAELRGTTVAARERLNLAIAVEQEAAAIGFERTVQKEVLAIRLQPSASAP